MKTFIHLLIKYGDPKMEHFGPTIASYEDFCILLSIAMRRGLTKDKAEERLSTIKIKCPPDSPGIEELFNKLRTFGWNPFWGYVPPNLRGDHFRVRTARIYDEADLSAAEFLYLRTWGEAELASFVGRDGERWIAEVESVGSDSGQGWNQAYGSVYQTYNYFVNTATRAQLERAELKGLKFHALQWNHPELAKGEFWEIDTNFTMPSCMDAVVDMDGLFDYEDLGMDPVELKFQRNDLSHMEPFDLAWGREIVGRPTVPHQGRHKLIVSQRFRRSCIEIGLTHAVYGIVRLVGD